MIVALIIVTAVAAVICATPGLLGIIIRRLPPPWLIGRNVSGQDRQVRYHTVKTFLTGLGESLARGNSDTTKLYSSLTPFEKPFYVEGAYAGLIAKSYIWPWRRSRIREFHNRHERFIFLLAIGAGFAGGLKTAWSPIISKKLHLFPGYVDDRLRQMVFDGYAFQKLVFHYRFDRSVLLGGLLLDPIQRQGFYEGAGRALWFLLSDLSNFQAAVSSLPVDCARECHIGLGIATGFAGIEQVASGILTTYPVEIRDSLDFYLGLVIGLFGRYYTAPDFVENLLQEQPDLLRATQQAATLFDALWQQNADYQQWRSVLRQQLEEPWLVDRTTQVVTKLATKLA